MAEEISAERRSREGDGIDFVEIGTNPDPTELMLPHESLAFEELHRADEEGGALVITSKGLGLHRLFLNQLKLYSDPALLVFVLNASKEEETYFVERMTAVGIHPLPKVVNNDTPASERQKAYLEGGVHFVTSRIFVVDLLTDKVPLDLTTGILVYRAHKILESCQESFILRLFRDKNKKGFVKAFSESPVAFTAGFCHVARVMKNLHVRNLFLLPRFHASVKETLETCPVDSVELMIPMTPAMISVQSALVDLIGVCLKELKAVNPLLDTDELTAENALTKSFDYLVKLYVDPVVHTLSFKSRQLLADVRTLRRVLQYLMQYDSVTFYSIVQSVWQSQSGFQKNAGWMFLDSADSLYARAKERVVGSACGKKSAESLTLEATPKWEALLQVLEEIEPSPCSEPAEKDVSGDPVLIVAEDDKTCSMLRDVLLQGPRELLLRKYVLLQDKEDNKSGMESARRELERMAATEEDEAGKKRKKMTELKNMKKRRENGLTLTQMVDVVAEKSKTATKAEDANSGEEPCGDAYELLHNGRRIVLHPTHGCRDSMSLTRVLRQLEPSIVVLYDPDVSFVRQLEIFRACRSRPLKVFFLMYADSVEEQKYLTSLRKEKEGFEYLIKEKSTLVVDFNEDAQLATELADEGRISSRKAGGQSSAPTFSPKVIVDLREFRSELPSLIHRRGIAVEPVTLEVGDYILSPEICVERKSVSDLIHSLNCGRLYNQAVAMTRQYRRPILLIEFDQSKSFCLDQSQYAFSKADGVDIKETQSKLTLLTIHFPGLRIIWSANPYATAEIFEAIKKGRSEPDAAAAIAIGQASLADGVPSSKYSPVAQDFLLKLPGVDTKNFRRLMNSVANLGELSRKTREELEKILDSAANAEKLWNFFHESHRAVDARGRADDKKAVKGRANFKYFGKRKKKS